MLLSLLLCLVTGRSLRARLPTEEVAHELRHQYTVLLECEVTRVEDVELQILEIALIRMGTGLGEDLVVLARLLTPHKNPPVNRALSVT